jgi:hypothetical protein
VEELILPDGDDMDIRSDEDESEEEELETASGFGSVIVVDNLPSVPEEKYEKLVNVLKKIYGQIGNIRDGAPGRRRGVSETAAAWAARACTSAARPEAGCTHGGAAREQVAVRYVTQGVGHRAAAAAWQQVAASQAARERGCVKTHAGRRGRPPRAPRPQPPQAVCTCPRMPTRCPRATPLSSSATPWCAWGAESAGADEGQLAPSGSRRGFAERGRARTGQGWAGGALVAGAAHVSIGDVSGGGSGSEVERGGPGWGSEPGRAPAPLVRSGLRGGDEAGPQ